MKNILKEGDIFVDIGANLGGYSFLAKSLKSDVFAYEPVKDLYKVLVENSTSFGNIYEKALSDKNETLKFYSSETNPDNTAVSPKI